MKFSPTLLSAIGLSLAVAAFPALAGPGPFDGEQFTGRIALSHDGNANDEDDWGAFPVIATLLDAYGVGDKLVHVDYNNILQVDDERFYREMTESVHGSIERYGLPQELMFDCKKDLEGAVASIRDAINASTAEDPLYYVLAGPMEVPLLGIQASDPAKRKHVYCISHSVWNDGFPQPEKVHLHKYTKRDIIGTGINWVQVKPGSGLTDSTRTSSTPQQWARYHWMRDAEDARLQWVFSRIEAVNFQHLENYEAERRNDRTASHRVAVAQEKPGTGRIRTVLDQPYAWDRGVFDVEVRFFDAKNAHSEYKLLVGGVQQGAAWTADGDTDSWQSRTIPGVRLNPGDEILVEARADGRDAAKLDYVQLAYAGAAATPPPATHPRFTPTGPLDDPDALPGQIIVVGENPGYLKYNGGGIAYLCGPDNPETFLYLGDLAEDGTRANGEQQMIIDRLAASGANVFHFILWRMHRSNLKGEGDDTHSPFVDHDPAKALNPAVLDQWEDWFTQLEAAGVVMQLEFYDDATDVEMMGWTLDADGNLHPDERRYIAGIVERFKHLRNIIWSIEESVNKLPRARIPHIRKVIELVAETDNHKHPIMLSFVTPDTGERDIGKDYVFPADYRDVPQVRLITWLHVLPHGEDYDRQHEAYLTWSRVGSGRFIMMKNETEQFPRTEPQSRIYQWASVMTGQHSLEAGHDVVRRGNLIAADGHIVAFMEQTDFHTMQPTDTLAHAATKWVLANPGHSYIAYTYDCDGPMGLKDMEGGTYSLLWFDTVNGKSVKQDGVAVDAGDATWAKPESLGTEIALYVKRVSGAGN